MEPQLLTLRDRARSLRRNQTEAERRLWMRLRFRQVDGAKFRRQHPIGPFIADFFCLERSLVVELDGGQHALHTERDQRRTEFFTLHGYQVIRFWNHEVLEDMDAVLQRILDVLQHPHPSPLPAGEGEK